MSVTVTGMAEVVAVDDLRVQVDRLRRAGAAVGFVPTMGALHEGHRRMLDVARAECDVLVASCYVNPTQFGAGEDLDRYPRSPEHDHDVAAAAGVDVLWRPTDRDVYGFDPARAVAVRVGEVGTVLEGAARPGHFDGVATVVVRLLAAVGPDVLYLGRKDYQQVAVLRRVVDDLLLPVDVRTVETVREADGLAMSSRNAYLDAAGRRAALAIPRALDAAACAVDAGERDARRIEQLAREVVDAESGVELDYAAVVADGTVDVIDELPGSGAVLLLAARVGGTRLIDNILLLPGSATPTGGR